MSQSYVKECIFCKTKIRMSDQKEGKWLAYNSDGSQQECKKKVDDKNNLKDSMKKIEKENQRTTLTVDEIIKGLKSIGINIDWDIFLKGTDPK